MNKLGLVGLQQQLFFSSFLRFAFTIVLVSV
jgi:hypothetical protein